jgi:hypothetical protein
MRPWPQASRPSITSFMLISASPLYYSYLYVLACKAPCLCEQNLAVAGGCATQCTLLSSSECCGCCSTQGPTRLWLLPVWFLLLLPRLLWHLQCCCCCRQW